MQHKWPEPAWIAALPKDQRGPSKVRYYLNLAAAYHNENGSLTELSLALDLSKSALHVMRQRGMVSPKLAVQIEQMLGRDHFPRELFNDIFNVSE